MELKGINQILEYCTEFINDIGDFEDVELDTDFSCLPDENEITIAVLASQISVQDFMTNLYTQTDIRDISEFTWSLLHEVGHCMTYDTLTRRELNQCEYLKKRINKGKIPSFEYYSLPDEYEATAWAIDFVTRWHEIVKEFDYQILKLLDEFYIQNNIEED